MGINRGSADAPRDFRMLLLAELGGWSRPGNHIRWFPVGGGHRRGGTENVRNATSTASEARTMQGKCQGPAPRSNGDPHANRNGDQCPVTGWTFAQVVSSIEHASRCHATHTAERRASNHDGIIKMVKPADTCAVHASRYALGLS